MARQAKCPYCNKLRDSSADLAFFESRDGDSQRAKTICGNCGFHEIAHKPGKTNLRICDSFIPHGAWDTDTFYCGCRGWD